MKFNKYSIVLVAIAVLSLVLRLYRVDAPVADWHSWRQADTSAVTRNFIKLGFDPFMPRYDDLSNIQTGKDNPEGYRFVEFPLYNSVSYMLNTIGGQGVKTVELWQRIVSIISSLISLVFIYLLTAKYANKTAGIAAAFIFGVLPYSVFYSRVILPEPLMVMLSLGTLYFFSRWADKNSLLSLGISALLAACALLVKPFAVFFFPSMAAIFLIHRSIHKKDILYGIVWSLLSLVPLILWRSWIQQFPEGIPAYDWLFNADNIRYKGAFFHWIFAERIAKLILGYYGLFMMLLGIIGSKKKGDWFFHVLGMSMVSYTWILAGGNVRHDYYQILLVPIIAMYCGKGIEFLISHTKTIFRPYLTYALITAVVTFTITFSWYQVRGYYWINNQAIVDAGRKADKLLPIDAKVVAPYGGDTAFLYHVNRPGWPQGFEVEDKAAKGATFYINTNTHDPEVEYLRTLYPVFYEEEGFVILTLQ